jgi:NAD(P)-dependent dehydrogenase (short-subunit alcohol dehydrogenase family)
MMAKRHGKIVNISSLAARSASIMGGAAYTAAKAGLLGFSRRLAREAAPYGINVNALCPGDTETPMTRMGARQGDSAGSLG